ncbi:hypothetical protein RUM43_005563 [Polyplax serrata]|uniref:Uncharacterized protein n=1 Tax=Polyplax serrata TaxID=468196 RepID=A0AAN8S8P2_POLSC
MAVRNDRTDIKGNWWRGKCVTGGGKQREEKAMADQKGQYNDGEESEEVNQKCPKHSTCETSRTPSETSGLDKANRQISRCCLAYQSNCIFNVTSPN